MARTPKKKPFPLLWPKHGVAHDQAHGRQRPRTTPKAVNVRAITAKSDRLQGGQRAGYSDFTKTALDAGFPVSALTDVVVDLPKFTFRGPSNSTLDLRWAIKSLGKVGYRAVEADVDGNLIALGHDATFERIGPDGAKLARHTVALQPGENMARRVQVDEEGNVYVCTAGPSYRTGRAMRYSPQGETAYALDWSIPLLSGVVDFRVSLGSLFLSLRNGKSDYESKASVMAWTNLDLSSPDMLWESGTPYPILAMANNDAGESFIAIKDNIGRGQVSSVSGTWYTPVVSWSPHALMDVSGYGASRRLYFWLDVTADANVVTPNARITGTWDRRWIHTNIADGDLPLDAEVDNSVLPQNPIGGGVHPSDGTHTFVPSPDLFARPGFTFTGQYGNNNQPLKDGPLLRLNGAGPQPSWRFDRRAGKQDDGAAVSTSPGQVIAFEPGSANDKKDTDNDGSPNDDGVLEGGGLFPGHANGVWTTFLIFRFNLSDRAQAVFHQTSTATTGGADRSGFGLAVNANERTLYATPTNSGASGSLCLGVRQGVADSYAGASDEIRAVDLTASPYANDRNIVIVAISNAGKYATGASDNVAPRDRMCSFRVNGRMIDRFTLSTVDTSVTFAGEWHDGRIQLTGIGSGSIVLDDNPANTPYGWQDLTPGVVLLDGLDSFDGDLMEVVTVLGSTSTATAPNQDNVTFPGQPLGETRPPVPGATEQWTRMGAGGLGEDYAVDALSYTQAASEIEQVEGYLAHKYGCPDILEQSGALTTSGNFQSHHPFGVGFPPVGPAGTGEITPSGIRAVLASTKQLLLKVGTSGELVWAKDGGGLGYGVATGPDGAVFTEGHHDRDTDSLVSARKIIDLGAAFDDSGPDTWEFESDYNLGEPSNGGGRAFEADDGGNLYWGRWFNRGGNLVLEHLLDGVPLAGDYIAIGEILTDRSWVYQWVAGAPGATVVGGATTTVQVQIGGASVSWQRMSRAIAASGEEGVDYGTGTEAHPDFRLSRYYRDLDGVSDWTTMEIRANAAGAASNGVNCGIGPGTPTKFGWVTPGTGTARATRGGNDYALAMHDKDTGDEKYLKTFDLDTEGGLTSIAFDPIIPNYPDDDMEGIPEFFYASFIIDGGSQQLRKYSQVSRVQTIGKNKSPREVSYLGICNGSLYRLERGEDPVAVPTGVGIFQANSPWITMFTYRSKVYMLDGLNYHRYDPKTQEAEEWSASEGGRIPYGAKLGCVWNARIVLARTPDDPHNLHMSARGDPDNWDNTPKVVSPLTAFSGSASGNLHFKKHDLVNCLIPAADDLLIIGGDQSIHRLTGDPGGQGQLDLVTDEEGLAFGAPWCKDPTGNVYVKGTNGGIYRLARDGAVNSITEHSIERDIRDIDLSLYDVVMTWNFRLGGLHVFQIPKGDQTGIIVNHWYWDGQEDGWWPDQFSDPSVQPTCVARFDGDRPDDRFVVIGCEDGFVRYEDELANDDGDHPIDSYVFFGPLVPGDEGGQFMFSHLSVQLAARYNGCRAAVFIDDVADWDGGSEPVAEEDLDPGINGYVMFEARGNQAWVRLGNATKGESWAMESTRIRARRAGEKRMLP